MNVSLPPEIQKQINDRVTSGQYQTAEDVIVAAVSSLAHAEAHGDFAPGELDALIAEGENDINAGNVVNGDDFFAELRKMSEKRRGELK